MSRPIDADALADKVADLYTEGDEAAEGDKVVNDVLDLIDKAPTVEYPEQITVECDTEEDKQKLLSALRNVKLKAVVEDERQGEWIPVSERLPEGKIDSMTNDFELVLCSTVWEVVRPYKFGKPIGHSKAHFWSGCGIMDDYVIAWMPLPEAYEEDNDYEEV